MSKSKKFVDPCKISIRCYDGCVITYTPSSKVKSGYWTCIGKNKSGRHYARDFPPRISKQAQNPEEPWWARHFPELFGDKRRAA